MKILWLVNLILPRVSLAIGEEPRTAGGWLTGLSDALLETGGYDIVLLFPHSRAVSGRVGRLSYRSFSGSGSALRTRFTEILRAEKPDVIHIHGTEYPHSLAMAEAAEALGLSARTAVSMQGLVSYIAGHYTAGLPPLLLGYRTPRDLLKRGGIAAEKADLERRGVSERKTLQLAGAAIGRTDWDMACYRQIDPNGRYFKVNEILRDAFYRSDGHWAPESCEPHSIFVSQALYPVKGFHLMLEALRRIARRYPDVRLYTTGRIPDPENPVERARRTAYERYIAYLLRKYGLRDRVTYLGTLSAEQMLRRYRLANVFVLPSTIENSPNSLGEAMMTGTPCVASDVGGVSSMMTHGEEGFLYPCDEPYMLADRVCTLFEDSESAERFSRAARARAAKTHDRQSILKAQIGVYEKLAKG